MRSRVITVMEPCFNCGRVQSTQLMRRKPIGITGGGNMPLVCRDHVACKHWRERRISEGVVIELVG